MTQLAISFDAPKPLCVVPPKDTQLGRLLRALQRGMRPTIITAGPELGIGALSQRIGQLRLMGWQIRDRRVAGKPYVEYYLSGRS
jgi:hypothetical protein